LICDRSHAEHSLPTTRTAGQTDGRTASRQLTRQPYCSNRLQRHSSSNSGSGTVMALTDGILHAPALLLLLLLPLPPVVKLHATDGPGCPPHSVVPDRHAGSGGGGGSGRLDEIGSIVRRTDRTSATTATDRPTAS